MSARTSLDEAELVRTASREKVTAFRGVNVRVPVAAIMPGDSPRLSGEDSEHVRLLAETDGPLPPVLVQRSTMRVVDGMHRLRAALLRGDETIEVEYFDGDEAEAFLSAVRANISHGLPLTLADREAAAARIVASHPHYSDRSIAAITGLAATTIAAVRRRGGADRGQVTDRIGRDGRMRPLSSADARRVASEVMANKPGVSLREVARLVGLSPATVRDVRDRVRRGDDPVPPRQRGEDGKAASGAGSGKSVRARGRSDLAPMRDRFSLLRTLSRDPSLRFSESGRAVLRWLSGQATALEQWEKIADAIPPHCGYLVAEVARGCAADWLAFSDQLEKHLKDTA